MLALADEHGVRYTGVIIENYEDDTDGTVKATTDTERFSILETCCCTPRRGAGIPRLQSSAVKSFRYGLWRCTSYKTWDSVDAMDRAVTEADKLWNGDVSWDDDVGLCAAMCALRRDGLCWRRNIRRSGRSPATIFPGEFAYVQEFGWQTTGSWNSHGSFSGCIIDSYMQMAALSG